MKLGRPKARVASLACLALCAGLAAGCGGGEVSPGAAAPAAAGRRIDPPAAMGSLAPNLTTVGGDVVLSWLEPLPGDRHRLLVSRLEGETWGPPSAVSEGERFFANWADLPAVAESGDGSLVAHWLASTGEDVYAYSVFLARSTDGGASWTEMGPLPDDDTPTEHGFVSYVPDRDGLRAFWLDGREMAAGGDMGLRTAWIGERVGPSELLDDRTCECCSTDAALSATGPLVVYRDRDAGEVRDVAAVRATADGWTDPAVGAADGWTIAGCPVNGPAVAAAGEQVALGWFTGAGGAPRVLLAFSSDGGGSYGRPLVIDDERPAGRVDVVLDESGGAVVGWLGVAGEAGSVRLRRARPDGGLGEPYEVARTGAGRASGFPRLVGLDGRLYVVWVDTAPADGQRIRALVMPLGQVPAPPTGGNAAGGNAAG